MKSTTLLACLLCTSAYSQSGYVKGYFKSNGTYVAPHIRSKADGVKYNNYNYDSLNDNSGKWTKSKGFDKYDYDYNSADSSLDLDSGY